MCRRNTQFDTGVPDHQCTVFPQQWLVFFQHPGVLVDLNLVFVKAGDALHTRDAVGIGHVIDTDYSTTGQQPEDQYAQ